MKNYQGFPDKVQYRAIPAPFFRDILPQITDLAELKASLYALSLISQKKGHPRVATGAELRMWWRAKMAAGQDSDAALRRGLELAVARGTLLHRAVERGGEQHDLYALNTAADARALEGLAGDEVAALVAPLAAELAAEPSMIFALYEENIGLITPLVADELLEAERTYPAEWVKDAFKEAVTRNRRNWRYIAKILERWAAEGRGDGETGRHSKTDDPEKYFRGRYGRLVQR